ncbi:serine/threonine-protein kinase [Nocardia donostiensis]|uniref:non-specific serine/threonine protein kinase n=1 Tax=Nocardia donostiensis TaxID=1538463 RepID=A0A1V2TBI8_9NOCA|nr:serine/threonine-protein kinase [Nocardia donostiensis]ONM46870.1 serine/threonine protein kinase [Nocardia donostiensis]OQS13220.1 serine/threonine protein kinase [Nocardia donostiensis]OQS19129.1 serine/threonine protein kinase [Nocardia donostiensis]
MIAEHYRLVERIGSGGTGVVWRAVDERLQRSVAIKQIHIKPSLPEAERDVLRQRATREARNAARFQHPNAIVVFDITEHGGDPCLVMEYLKSRSLAMVLSAQGALPLAQVARIGEQVASALIAAHQAGLVHRDVKPGNILLDDHGTVKITDFGISRAAGDVTLTETGLICGTAAYLAPEVARGADPSPAADVFSLGATLFHALEGEPPYGTGANPLAVLYAAANGQVSEPRNAGPATDFLLQLLSPRPEDRPTMRAARDQLAMFADTDADQETVGFVPASEAFGRSQNGAATRTLQRAEPIAAPTERQQRPAPPRPAGVHPDTAAHPRPTAQPGADNNRAPGKRRAVLIGGIAGAVIAGSTLYFTVFDDGSGNTSSVQAETPSSTPSPDDTDSDPNTPALGETPSVSTVQWVPAGQLIERFYSNPAGSWSLLTPAAQQVYGSEQKFRQFWSQNTIQSFSTIEAYKGNNSDGSVDMRIHNLSYGGQTKQLSLRIVDTGQGLLIDSDTR